jgi:hypothetical protein
VSFLGGGVVGSAYRVWFTLDDGKGALKTGVAGDATFTVLALDDSATTAPTVVESTQAAGTYYADVPGSFLTTHGAGNYAVQIVVAATGPKFDAVAGRHFVVGATDLSTIAASIWDELLSGHTIVGSAGDNLRRVFEMLGLDAAKPYVNGPTSITVGDMTFTITEAPAGTFTLTRTA